MSLKLISIGANIKVSLNKNIGPKTKTFLKQKKNILIKSF